MLTLITDNYDDSSYLSLKGFVFLVSQQQPDSKTETVMETRETDTNDRDDNKERQQRIDRQLLMWESIFVGTDGADCKANVIQKNQIWKETDFRYSLNCS